MTPRTNENDEAMPVVYPCPINILYHTRYVYIFTLAQYCDYVNKLFYTLFIVFVDKLLQYGPCVYAYSAIYFSVGT